MHGVQRHTRMDTAVAPLVAFHNDAGEAAECHGIQWHTEQSIEASEQHGSHVCIRCLHSQCLVSSTLTIQESTCSIHTCSPPVLIAAIE